MKISKHEEKLLLKRLRLGDSDAYSEIYKIYHPKLFRYAYTLSKNTNLAEDIVQEQLMRLWTKKEKLDIASLNAYLYKLVFNGYMDYYSAEKRKLSLHEQLRMEAVMEVENTDTAQKEERLAILNKIIAQLPEKRREIFILNKLKNYEYREIAEIKGISVRTVEGQIRKALITIRSEIAGMKSSKNLHLLLFLESFL